MKKIERSKTVVNNFLNLNDNYGKRISRGKLKALLLRKVRTVLHLDSAGKYSNMEIIMQTSLIASEKIFAILPDELIICNMEKKLP